MRLLYAVLFLFVSLYGQGLQFVNPNPGEFNDSTLNEVRRPIHGTVTVAGQNITVRIFTPPRLPAIQATIDAGHYADILVDDTTVSFTRSQINSTGHVDVGLTITAKPNPTAPPPYTVALAVFSIQLNLNYYSDNFFQLQANPISINPTIPASGSTPAFFTFANTKLWLRLPEGGIISTSSFSDQIISPPATATTLTLQITSAAISPLVDGTYYFSLLASMNPTAPAPNQALQTTVLTNYLNTINSLLSPNSTLQPLTTTQIQNLTANRTLIESLLTQ